MNKTDEIVEKLNENFKIIQKKDGYKYGIDTILLFRFANLSINKKIKLLDIGTGNGILPVLLSSNDFIDEIVGVDIQEENIERAKKSLKINSIDKKIYFECIDIKKYSKGNYFDVIISNPPYMEVNGKKINEDRHKALSRHEISLNLEDFVKYSKKFLKSVGKLCFIHRTFRLVEILKELDKNGFCVSKIVFIYSSNNESNMMYIEALKGKKKKLEVENYFMREGIDYD